MCKDPKALEHVIATLNATGKADKLKGYELIKAIHLEPTWVPWLRAGRDGVGVGCG